MKIVGIQSSPRGKNSNTLKLLNAALDGAAEDGAEVEIIDVAKLKIQYCNACNSCQETVCAQSKKMTSKLYWKSCWLQMG